MLICKLHTKNGGWACLRCFSRLSFWAMSAIDIHTHAFPDGLAKRAIQSLEAAASWKSVGPGTIKGLIKSMDRADIDISVICNIATKPDQAEAILGWCREIDTDRIIPLPSVHPKTEDLSGWVKRIADEGFHGIKLHPMYQDFPADDPAMDEFYAAVRDEGLMVTLHCGKDIAFPEDDDRAAPRRFANLIERFPGLKLVCTHMGGWKDWDQVEEHLIGKDVYLETSFSLMFLEASRAADMIIRHGTDKVLLGSDWPWADQGEEIERIRNLGLDEKATDGILWSNAARLLGL